MHCPACDGEATLRYRLTYPVYQCHLCGLYFAQDPSFHMDFKSMVDERVREIALKQLRMANFTTIVSHLSNLLREGATGLEVGSGYGWFLDAIAQAGYQCFGIEPEPAMVEKSRAAGHKIIQGFFPADLPEFATHFDFVVFNDALEHIPNIQSILRATHSLLNPGGILVVNLPLSDGLFYRLAHLANFLGVPTGLERLWQFAFTSPHYYYFSRKNLASTLKRYGFEPVAYHRVKTLDPNRLVERISMDVATTRLARVMSLPLRMGVQGQAHK